MSSKILIYGTTNTSAASTLKSLSNVSIANAFRNLGSWFQRIGIGAQNFNGSVITGAVSATGSVTFTGRPVADETLSIGNVTLTAKDSGANGTTQFNTAVSTTTTATNLAACINANTTLNLFLSATSSLGVVTITSSVPGVVGNALQLSESLTNATASAFASGANTTTVNLAKGI